jgi:Holliday junction resolvase RusA-like endonuclease
MAHGRAIMHSPKTGWYHLVYGEGLRARPAEPLDVPVWLNVVFIFPRPKSAKKAGPFKGTKPDLDNLVKAVKDALTHARWWTDDGRVARSIQEKRFATDGEACGAEISAGIL